MADIVFSGVNFSGGFSVTAPPPDIRAIFGYGASAISPYSFYSLTNLVSNTGVVANDTTGVGTARQYLASASYGS